MTVFSPSLYIFFLECKHKRYENFDRMILISCAEHENDLVKEGSSIHSLVGMFLTI